MFSVTSSSVECPYVARMAKLTPWFSTCRSRRSVPTKRILRRRFGTVSAIGPKFFFEKPDFLFLAEQLFLPTEHTPASR